MSARIWSPEIVELGDRIADMSLAEAALLSLYLAEAHGLSAAPATHVPEAPEPNVVIVDKPSTFDVVLTGLDPGRRVSVLKEVRQLLSLGLKEARDLVEAVPQTIKHGLSREEAGGVQVQLEAAGAKVALRTGVGRRE
jgi:large subunit ribosomal protein L7/L12